MRFVRYFRYLSKLSIEDFSEIRIYLFGLFLFRKKSGIQAASLINIGGLG